MPGLAVASPAAQRHSEGGMPITAVAARPRPVASARPQQHASSAAISTASSAAQPAACRPARNEDETPPPACCGCIAGAMRARGLPRAPPLRAPFNLGRRATPCAAHAERVVAGMHAV
jgi:hypothetical protein